MNNGAATVRAFANRFQRWLGDHPWVVVSFLAGAALGTTIALPVLDVELPDGVATLWGAILGAGIAVYGAAWITGHRERRQQDVLHGTVLGAVMPLESKVQSAMTVFGLAPTLSGPQWNEAHRELDRLDKMALYISGRLADLRPACYVRADWLSSLELVIATLDQIHELVSNAAELAKLHEQGHPTSAQQREKWRERAEVLQSLHTGLVVTARRFPIPSTRVDELLQAQVPKAPAE